MTYNVLWDVKPCSIQFCKAGCHAVRRNSRTTVAQYNSKIRAADAQLTDLPSDTRSGGPVSTLAHFASMINRRRQNHDPEVTTAEAASFLSIWYGVRIVVWSDKLQPWTLIGPEHFDLYASNRYVLNLILVLDFVSQTVWPICPCW